MLPLRRASSPKVDGIQCWDGDGSIPPEETDRQWRKANKLLFKFQNGNWRYLVSAKDGFGRTVRFCYSLHRNVSGYFLAWREVVCPAEGKIYPDDKMKPGDSIYHHRSKTYILRRYDIVARRSRKRAAAVAKRRGDAFKAKQVAC